MFFPYSLKWWKFSRKIYLMLISYVLISEPDLRIVIIYYIERNNVTKFVTHA
jgi:hypothetical protein